MEVQNNETPAYSGTRTALTVADICYIAVFTAVIAVMAQLSIPMPGGVPMTLQTLAVPLAAIILGTRRGTAAVAVYLLLGAAGAPVFSGFAGGIGKLFGMTGGFLFSFPLMALAAGLGAQLSYNVKGNAFVRALPLWTGLILGAVINYAVGTAWFMFVADAGLMYSLSACVIPFIPTSVLKIVLAGLLGPMLRKTLMRAGLFH